MADASVIERYVGLDYVPGHFDCLDLAARVQREVYGRDVRRLVERVRPTTMIGMVRAIAEKCEDVARRRPPGEMYDGDGVLLARGSGFPSHIGVLVQLGDPAEWYVLHNASVKVRSVLTLMRDLPLHGWRVEGVYAWL